LARYTLMSKDREVLDFEYDAEIHAVLRIIERKDVGFAPPALIDPQGTITRRNLNDWWASRAIPVSRQQFQSLRDQLGVADTRELTERSRALSLTDRYWVREEGDDASWADVNFFDNGFDEELGLVTLGQDSTIRPSFCSPNASLAGDLRKKWTMRGGRVVLMKAASGAFGQEPYNEVAATALMRRILDPGEYVEYGLVEEAGRTYSACESMVTGNLELIPAADLLRSAPGLKNTTGMRRLTDTLGRFGVPDPGHALSKMLAVDYLLGNFDRHYNNFGILRDSDDHSIARFAPIYDTGSSLWMDQIRLEAPVDWENQVRPFDGENLRPGDLLRRLPNLSWLDPAKLDGFDAELAGILARNPLMPPARIEAIAGEVSRRMATLSAQAGGGGRRIVSLTRNPAERSPEPPGASRPAAAARSHVPAPREPGGSRPPSR
jgi:hypothetical protein